MQRVGEVEPSLTRSWVRGKSTFREDIAMAGEIGTERIHTYCALCIARCGAIATVENGRFTRLDSDPGLPTGQSLCANVGGAPAFVSRPMHLTLPLRGHRPKRFP